MTVAFLADASTAQPGGGATLTVNKPAGTLDGHVMIAIVRAETATAFDSIPSGWTSLFDAVVGGNRHGVWYKVASSEGASYAWGIPGLTTRAFGIITSFSGADISNPVGDFLETSATPTGTANVAPSITPTRLGLAVAMFSCTNGAGISATSVDNGFTVRNTGGGTKGLFTATKAAVAGAATGATTFTSDSPDGNACPGVQLVVNDVRSQTHQMLIGS